MKIDKEKSVATNAVQSGFLSTKSKDIPGNPIFLAIHQALVDWVIDARPENASSNELNAKSYQDHVEIFKCIKKHDVEGADKKLTQHIEYVFDNYYTE